MKAVILAAGKGSRLNPLTKTRPKHILPVAGKPVIVHVVENLSKLGIRDIGIVVHHYREMIESLLGDGSRLNVNITYIYQEVLNGTATAVEIAEDFVRGDDFILVYGDVLFEPRIVENALKVFRSGVDGVVIGVEVDNPWEFGVFIVQDGCLKGVIEKPPKGTEPSNLINSGIYVLKPTVFDYVKRVGFSERKEREFTDAIMMMCNDCRVAIVNGGSGWWFDVGRPWDLIDANKYYMNKLIKHNIKGKLNPGVTIEGEVYIDKGTVVRSGAVIVGPAYIGKNCTIGYSVVIGPYTYIGDNVTIGPLSYIENSIILGNATISSHCAIFESIIGEYCYLESGVKIPCYSLSGENIKVLIKNKKVDSGRKKLGAIIGDEVKIGANVSFAPGITVKSKSIIKAGSRVDKDIL